MTPYKSLLPTAFVASAPSAAAEFQRDVSLEKQIMTALIIIFGALILLAGVVIVINPEVIFGYLRTNIDKLAIHILAVVVRLIIGVLLITQNSLSKYPLVIEILGWFSIVAAFALAVMGRHNFYRLMSWALSGLKPFARVGGVFAAAFGGFLIYAFV
ncbi:MAG: hypothetical protein WBQ78_12360 [Gammaproteobacteria bacterium]